MGNNKSKGAAGGGGGETGIPNKKLSEALERLRRNNEECEKWEKKIKHHEAKANSFKEEAKKYKKEKNPKMMTMALKRKIREEKSLANAFTSLETLEAQKILLQQAVDTASVAKTMERTNVVLKGIDVQKQVEIIADVAADMQEQNDMREEVNDIMGEAAGIGVDDEELQKQMADLSEEELEDSLQDIKVGGQKLPEVKPVQVDSTEEDAKKLEADLI